MHYSRGSMAHCVNRHQKLSAFPASHSASAPVLRPRFFLGISQCTHTAVRALLLPGIVARHLGQTSGVFAPFFPLQRGHEILLDLHWSLAAVMDCVHYSGRDKTDWVSSWIERCRLILHETLTCGWWSCSGETAKGLLIMHFKTKEVWASSDGWILVVFTWFLIGSGQASWHISR